MFGKLHFFFAEKVRNRFYFKSQFGLVKFYLTGIRTSMNTINYVALSFLASCTRSVTLAPHTITHSYVE